MSLDQAITELGLEPNIPAHPARRTAAATRSRAALDWAEGQDNMGLTYRRPVDMRDPKQEAALRSELGDEVAAPDDNGLYYLASVRSPGRNVPTPVVIREGSVVDFVRRHHALMVADTVHRLLRYIRPVDTAAAARLQVRETSDPDGRRFDGHELFLVEVNGHLMVVGGDDVFKLIVDLYALSLAGEFGLLTYHGPDVADSRFHQVDIDRPRGAVRVRIPLGDVPVWTTVLSVAADSLPAERGQRLHYRPGIVL